MKVASKSKDGVSEWKFCRNKRYLDVNFRGLNDAEVITLMLTVSRQLRDSGVNSVLIITDLECLDVNVDLYSSIRECSKRHQKYTLRSAIIGVKPKLFLFYKLYKKVTNTKAKVFVSKVEALDYILN